MIKESRSAEAKGSSNGPKPTHLAFYPHRWKNFLEDAKGDCRAYHALNKPFPNVVHDLTGTITETLMTTLVSWSQAGKLFEPGKRFMSLRRILSDVTPDIWPLHKPDMARLVCMLLICPDQFSHVFSYTMILRRGVLTSRRLLLFLPLPCMTLCLQKVYRFKNMLRGLNAVLRTF